MTYQKLQGYQLVMFSNHSKTNQANSASPIRRNTIKPNYNTCKTKSIISSRQEKENPKKKELL